MKTKALAVAVVMGCLLGCTDEAVRDTPPECASQRAEVASARDGLARAQQAAAQGLDDGDGLKRAVRRYSEARDALEACARS